MKSFFLCNEIKVTSEAEIVLQNVHGAPSAKTAVLCASARADVSAAHRKPSTYRSPPSNSVSYYEQQYLKKSAIVE
jgi:hypothetical protein